MARDELASLFERFRAHGDVAALSEAFARTAPELLQLARHLAPDEAAAEDLVQATFVAAIEHAARFDAERGLVPWLIGVLTNKAKLAQALRARVTDAERLAEREPPDPALDAELREFVGALERALERVPSRYRAVLRSHLSEGKRPEEIASELGRPPGTVRVQLHRGLAHLRRALPPGFALGIVAASARARGVHAIRADVLRHARHFGPAAASSSLVLGGLVVKTQFVVAAAVALLAAAAVWQFRRQELAPAEPGQVALAPSSGPRAESAPRGVAASEAVEREPVSAAPSAQAALGDPYGALELEVVWHDGTPAAGIAVECMPLSEPQPIQSVVPRVTDEQGRAQVERIRAGALALSVPMLRHELHPLAIQPGVVNSLRVELPAGHDVRGRVIDADGRAVAGALVWTKHGPNPMIEPAIAAATTGGDGTFLLRSALQEPPGTSAWLHLFATAERRGSSADVAVAYDETPAPAFVELRLRGESADVEGRVLSPEGGPVENARVSLRCQNSRVQGQLHHWPWLMLRTDAQGVFRASGLHPGQVEVLVGARLYALWAEHVVLESGAKRTLEARLEYGVSVSGSLSDEQGASVAPALVGWETPSELYFVEDVWPVFTQADAHGRYRLEGLPSGKLTLCASHGQGASRRRSVRDFETRPGEHVVWDVVFDDGLTITGRAQDPAGAPLVGWAVQAMQVPNVDRSLPEIATTAADGRFVITNLRDVPHQVLLYRTKNSDDWLAKVENVRPGEAEVVLVFDEADRPAAYLTGSVVGADGRPVVGADLFARPHTNDGSCNGKTDAPDGSFRIGPLRQGGHELSIQAAGQPSFEVAVPALAAGEERDLGVLVVPATGDAEIVLTTRASAPLEKPVVLLFSTPTRAHPLSSDDDAITFRTGPLFPGTYRLFVVAENAASEIHPIEIRPGETARARFELAPGARRLFFLRPAANDPVLGPVRIVVRDAEERVVLEDQRAFERAVKPGENHSLYMASFPYGTLRIDVQADDGRSASLAFTVQSGPVPPPLELQFPAKRDL